MSSACWNVSAIACSLRYTVALCRLAPICAASVPASRRSSSPNSPSILSSMTSAETGVDVSLSIGATSTPSDVSTRGGSAPAGASSVSGTGVSTPRQRSSTSEASVTGTTAPQEEESDAVTTAAPGPPSGSSEAAAKVCTTSWSPCPPSAAATRTPTSSTATRTASSRIPWGSAISSRRFTSRANS